MSARGAVPVLAPPRSGEVTNAVTIRSVSQGWVSSRTEEGGVEVS